ncbi:uncharacterized protein TRIADDRAFT_58035 [Trichoplax adhaerens]|uniref:Uncharacterized protein n=1 Tax=Trichoplax adhaerens TaxID=10228 RepID=B3S2I3_TRIAD|nr:hypothetical protein TRIADDRAFT_58035 [Trichoplax adhaerens]EDV23425.1 hypothetical protein TRIADDRAFT_58035 [Trichoplax adhaerens]|eukprot:XP_002114335.1 hypothetical protein TRIADDRAFT_58035 [Trichoplax adhaerens]
MYVTLIIYYHKADHFIFVIALWGEDYRVEAFLCGRKLLTLPVQLEGRLVLVQIQLSSIPRVCSRHMTAECNEKIVHELSKVKDDVMPSSSNTNIYIKKKDNGIYAGKFSGRFKSCCFDNRGCLRRDATTVRHILNDLIAATMKQQGHTLFDKNNSCNSTANETVNNHGIPICNNNIDKSKHQNEITRTKMTELRKILKERDQRRRRFNKYKNPLAKRCC